MVRFERCQSSAGPSTHFSTPEHGELMLRNFKPALVLLLFILLAPQGAWAKAPPLSLNGDWNFLTDPQGKLTVGDLASAANVRPTRVPSSWQQQFTDLRDYAGVAWYWRVATVDALSSQQVALLRFGAVDYRADVYVNGQRAGSHDGGYLPFEFDVSSLLRAGENQIAVRVVDASAVLKEVEGIKYDEIPHGKQNWYVETSGLWQDVSLDIRPRMNLGAVHITAGMDGKFKIQTAVNNVTVDLPIAETLRVKALITDPEGKEVWSGAAELKRDQSSYEIAGSIANPRLWWTHNPALYTLHVSLPTGDSQDYRFGFRTFETRSGKFYLNGHVIYLRAPLDQDFYPDTIYTPPSYEYLKSEMQQAKALGFNMMRCHIKVPDPRYLEATDEVGLLVWYEIPNWDKLTEDAKRRGRETLQGMVERDWNHPSIVVVSVINESWGANLKDPNEASQRDWLKAAYYEAKKMVPGWLVVDNSACCDNFHMVTDIADFHQYNAVPDNAADFDRFIEDMARRPGWLLSPFNDAVPRGDEPLVLSEFGNWGLPRLEPDKPWWFDRAFGFEPRFTKPGGVEQRFADFGLNSIFGSYNDLADATQAHQLRALKHEIESIRSRPQMEGYVITEFTDLNWEANGVLDMWRKPKSYAAELARLQQDDLLIARTERRNLEAGDKGSVAVSFSHYSRDSYPSTQVAWELEGTPVKGVLALPVAATGTVVNARDVEFVVPDMAAPAKRIFRARLMAGDKVVSETYLEFFFYPKKPIDLPPPVSFHDPAGRLRRLVNDMRARNYLEPTGKESFPVLIASTLDDRVKKTLEDGGRVILLTADQQTIAPGIEIVPRAGTLLDGNWISSYLWIRKDQEPFKSVGFETLPGFEVQSVAPRAVVQGLKPEDYGDVLSGIFYGWIHSSVGTVVQAKAGKGRLLICTYALGTTYGTDPYGTYLLDALVRYVVTAPAPRLEIPL